VERELQEELREQAKTIRDSVNMNDADTKKIAQRSAPESGQRQMSPDMFGDFKQAADEQVKRLGGAEEQAEKKIAETLQDLSAMQELIKDFNQFQSLYQAQQAIAEQCKAYDRAGQLSREDQLALKNMAALEKQVGDILGQLAEKLRTDAKTAEKNFPKAAQSAQDLAEQIEEAQLKSLAKKATDKMLSGKGDDSFQSAERLRSEMEKMFSQCQAQGGAQQGELDQYLRLRRGMDPGKTWAQMMRSRNFSRPGSKQRGQGMQGQEGDGQQGDSGFSFSTQVPLGVLGNESMINRDTTTDRHSDKNGMAKNKPQKEFPDPAVDKTETMKGLNPVNRQSGAVQSESIIEEYNDVVDKYFKAITKEPKK
jgi:hypothetical protein